jgi:hypothetical protein
MPNKKYYVINDRQAMIKQLTAQGIKVTAQNDTILSVEFDTTAHSIAEVEAATGLTFADKEA